VSRNSIIAFFFGIAIGVVAMSLRPVSPVHAAAVPTNGYGISANGNGAFVVSSATGIVIYCDPTVSPTATPPPCKLLKGGPPW